MNEIFGEESYLFGFFSTGNKTTNARRGTIENKLGATQELNFSELSKSTIISNANEESVKVARDKSISHSEYLNPSASIKSIEKVSPWTTEA